MKKLSFILFACFAGAALSGCGTQTGTVLFKPQTPPAVKQADLDKCKIASFRAIPQAYTTQYVGGYYNPGYIDCHHYGRRGSVYCDQLGGFYSPPVGYTEDMNGTMRWRYVSACLAQKGYFILYNRPRCTNSADRARSLAAKTPADLVCNPDAGLDY